MMRKIWFWMKWGAMVFFFIQAVRYSVLARTAADRVTVMLTEGGLEVQAAAEICTSEAEQENPLALCFWGEQPEMELTCRETGSSCAVTELTAVGKQELIVPGGISPVLQEGDCLIDTETAWALFGNSSAAGQTLWCGDRAYRVCGTFECLQRTFLHPAVQSPDSQQGASASSGNGLDRISIKTKAEGDTEQFLVRYGLVGESIDFTFLNALSQDLLLLLPLFLTVKLFLYLQQKIRENEDRRKRFSLLLFSGGLIFSGIFILRTTIQIPADMIPTKWSDFSFWESWWKGQCRNLLLILGSSQGEVQLMMLWRLLLSAICNGIALALVFLLDSAKKFS